MSDLENYTQLKDALTTFLFHQRFVPQYDRATILFETAANRRLRVRDQQHTSNLTLINVGDYGPTCDLPLGYLAWRAVNWRGRDPYVPLDYVAPSYLSSTWLATDNGDPKVFSIDGDNFYAQPPDTSTAAFQMSYFQLIETITGVDRITQGDNSGENWLIHKYPDAYLYGVLTELFALNRNREAAELYKARRDEVFAEIERVSSFSTGATSALVREGSYY